MITLTLKKEPEVPIEAEALSPDIVSKLSNDELRALPIFYGKHQLRLDEFFEVEGELSEELEIHGAASRVKWLGRGMTHGQLRSVGSAGLHLGAFMKGGNIDVTGKASDWIGAEMARGLNSVGGNASR